jgi:hypothetical protein
MSDPDYHSSFLTWIPARSGCRSFWQWALPYPCIPLPHHLTSLQCVITFIIRLSAIRCFKSVTPTINPLPQILYAPTALILAMIICARELVYNSAFNTSPLLCRSVLFHIDFYWSSHARSPVALCCGFFVYYEQSSSSSSRAASSLRVHTSSPMPEPVAIVLQLLAARGLHLSSFVGSHHYISENSINRKLESSWEQVDFRLFRSSLLLRCVRLDIYCARDKYIHKINRYIVNGTKLDTGY